MSSKQKYDIRMRLTTRSTFLLLFKCELLITIIVAYKYEILLISMLFTNPPLGGGMWSHNEQLWLCSILCEQMKDDFHKCNTKLCCIRKQQIVFKASIEAPLSLYVVIFDILQYSNVRYCGIEYQWCNFTRCLFPAHTELFGFSRPTGELTFDWVRV